jgi:hypothetical protein
MYTKITVTSHPNLYAWCKRLEEFGCLINGEEYFEDQGYYNIPYEDINRIDEFEDLFGTIPNERKTWLLYAAWSNVEKWLLQNPHYEILSSFLENPFA